ncbi:MAG: restriction endonuclease subunit S [Flavobacteriaceae bacterium]|nr:restriction endonuclease subunit S [Flavobacteriaceae bacterium]
MMVQETYKTTWLANAPEHWNTLRIKNIFAEIDDRSETGKEELLSVSHYTGVTKKKDSLANEDDFISNAKTLVGYKKVAENDLVSNIMLAWNGSLGISKYNGITSPAYCVYRIKGDNNPDYYGYLFSTAFMKAEFRKKSYGIIDSRLRLYSDKFFSIPAPVPPKTEQDQIVAYIKEQSKKIKHFIKKKQTFIALLKEQRQAVLNKAVTKGVNPNVKLKDSGIDWLGDIPEHWKVTKINGLCNFVRGNSSFKKDELLNKGKYVALQYGKTYKVDEVDENFQFYVNEEFYKSTQTIKFGDIIVVSTSETIEDLGHSVFYNRNDIGLLGGEQMALKPYAENIDSKFLYYSSKVFTKSLQKFATGVKVFRFNINHLKTIYTSVPPKEEQAQIVLHIKTETAKIDQAITQAQKEIELIKEYKEAMIAEAVLGKFNHKIVKS